jgi:hypothetical protein
MLTRVNRVLVTNKEGSSAGTTVANLVSGDVVAFNRSLTKLAGTETLANGANNDVLYVGLGNEDGTTILSSPIQVRNITKVTVQPYVTPVEKVMVIGYDGTSGTITSPSNNEEWNLIINYKDDQRYQNQRITRGLYNYVTDATASTSELVFNLAKKVASDSNAFVKAEVLVDQAGAAAVETATTTFGSNIIVTSAAPTFAVGDVIRIGVNDTTTGAYKVVSIDGNNVKISSPFQGASGAGLAIAVVTGITSYGIRLTGEKVAYNSINFYAKVDFDCFLAPVLGGTDNTEAKKVVSEINYGQGYWQQVKDMEYLAKAYLGDTNEMLFPVKNLPFNTKIGDDSYTYRTITIESFDKHQGDLQGQYAAPISTNIVFKTTGGAQSTNEADFIAQITALIESAGAFVA